MINLAQTTEQIMILTPSNSNSQSTCASNGHTISNMA